MKWNLCNRGIKYATAELEKYEEDYMQKIITNGIIVLEDQMLQDNDVVIENDRITGIRRTGDTDKTGSREIYDAGGAYIMPGIIDIHSDMIETYIQPRSTAVMDFEMALGEAERVLAVCGITTMFHSISMFRDGSWDVKEIRQSSQVKKLAGLIGEYRHRRRLIRHRYHLRYEIDNLDCYEEVAAMLEGGLVDLLSFMDHSPGQGQYKNLDIYRKHQPDEGRGLSGKEFEELVKREMQKKTVTFPQLRKLAEIAAKHGISVASHDDDTIEKLDMNRELGVSISEFPITLEVAETAVKQGLQTVLGAPNILLGGSHSGNLSALEAVRAGAANILVSDYYPQALLQAVFCLNREHGIPLWEAVQYVTANPAKAVGLDQELGSVEIGKRADLLIVDAEEGKPAVKQVFVNGECIMECRYRVAD